MITSTFVARARPEAMPSGTEEATAAQLHQIEERLERIEAALTRPSTPA